jgi:hypothetical protein
MEDRRPDYLQMRFWTSAIRWRQAHRALASVDAEAWLAMDHAIDRMHDAATALDRDGFVRAFHAYRENFARFTAARAGRPLEHPLRPTIVPVRTTATLRWDHDAMLLVLAIAQEERALSPHGSYRRAAERLRRMPEFSAYHSLSSPITASKVSGVVRRLPW